MNEAKKIMICDDDASIVEMFELILEETGAQISSERNSVRLFDRLLKDKPDSLILDISMPGLTGDQILKHIRSDRELFKLPVIMVSAEINGAKIARESGANSFYEKPFVIEDFLNEVETLLIK